MSKEFPRRFSRSSFSMIFYRTPLHSPHFTEFSKHVQSSARCEEDEYCASFLSIVPVSIKEILGVFTIYMWKPVGSRFVQMLSKFPFDIACTIWRPFGAFHFTDSLEV